MNGGERTELLVERDGGDSWFGQVLSPLALLVFALAMRRRRPGGPAGA